MLIQENCVKFWNAIWNVMILWKITQKMQVEHVKFFFKRKSFKLNANVMIIKQVKIVYKKIHSYQCIVLLCKTYL